ncbi:hypothetical protein LTS18_003438 [Coniosporium uncinatum]|uniref:Uncharacterized protein n=1 Tax=Coniosporium uncinatum TaxID=93489 RepID=A0ACC3DYE5_9PEZI|nr:hypothetical protein LTS18_003438 [Coniosporium uncinatum]
MAETEFSEGEEAALAKEPVGKPIAGVTISQEELTEVLKMVDEEASREAEQQRQSQISTEDEAEVVRPPEKGKRKASVVAEQASEVVVDGVTTRGRQGVRKPKKALPETTGHTQPTFRSRKVPKATKRPPKKASLPSAATKPGAVVSKPVERRRKKQIRAATPPPAQSQPATPAGSSPLHILSPNSQKVVQLPERPSPHIAKRQRTAPEPKAPPKYILKSKTFYHNEKVDSWDEFFEVDKLLFNRFTQKADAVARLTAEEAGNLYTVLSRIATIHGSGGSGSQISFSDQKITDHISWAVLLGKVQSMYTAGKKLVTVEVETKAARRSDWQPEPAAPVAVPASTQAKKGSTRPPLLTQSSQPSARAAAERRETLKRSKAV